MEVGMLILCMHVCCLRASEQIYMLFTRIKDICIQLASDVLEIYMGL